jgi:hypothetical protein
VVEGEVEHLEAEAQRRADLVDGAAAGREVLQHLPVDLGGVGRYAARGHAVACREDADEGPLDGRHRLALPGRQPFHEPLEPAEAAGRLGELAVALPHRPDGALVGTGNACDEATDVVERGAGIWHGEKLQRRRGSGLGREL